MRVGEFLRTMHVTDADNDVLIYFDDDVLKKEEVYSFTKIRELMDKNEMLPYQNRRVIAWSVTSYLYRTSIVLKFE